MWWTYPNWLAKVSPANTSWTCESLPIIRRSSSLINFYLISNKDSKEKIKSSYPLKHYLEQLWVALDKENNLSGGVCSRSANRVRQELATVLRRWEEVSSGHLVEDIILSPSWRYPLSCIAPRLRKKTDHWKLLFTSLHYVWQMFFNVYESDLLNAT